MTQTVDTFARQYARTQRLTLGEPRNIVVSPDGMRVVFCRSSGGSDTVNSLYVLHTATSVETCVADMREIHGSLDDSPAERARRERTREGASGIVSFSCDTTVSIATYCVGGMLFVTDLIASNTTQIALPSHSPVFDPRISPDGKLIAYVRDNTLCYTNLDGREHMVASELPAHLEITWGLAEFVAAEEMGRQRGYWWSPDSTRLAVCRTDLGAVENVWIGEPADPVAKPRAHRYPFAGTANARVSLHIFDLDAHRLDVQWDNIRFEYLTQVQWNNSGLLIALQTRDQQTLDIRLVDEVTGTSRSVHTESDEQWVDLVSGSPTMLDDGRVVICGERNGVRALVVARTTVTPADMQVRSIIATTPTAIYFLAHPLADPTVMHVMRCDLDDLGVRAVTTEAGMHSAAVGGNTVVIRRASLEQLRTTTRVVGGTDLTNHAETSILSPNVSIHRVGAHQIATAIVLPDNHDGSPLPVLFDPYGGPHAQRVVCSAGAYFAAQWFANQGFCVVIADGRGTPGRGTQWERAVHHDLATPILDDQIEVLHALPNLAPCADTTRVGIRGWSFGGYLAALAVLREPDLFHAAVAGAPVTKWDLYDTHYTERYMGDPLTNAHAYEATSLVAMAHMLKRPLLLIHGLSDDNVLFAHTMQLSTALLHHGKPHELLALSGVSHMTPQETVAENLLLHQLEFLQRHLSH